MQNEKKIFCGNGKKIAKDGIKVSVNLSKLPKEFINASKTGDKWINLVMWPTPDNQYGNDYSLSVDTFKPEPKAIAYGAPKDTDFGRNERLSNDQGLPF